MNIEYCNEQIIWREKTGRDAPKSWTPDFGKPWLVKSLVDSRARVRKAGIAYGYASAYETALLDRNYVYAHGCFARWIKSDADCMILVDHDHRQILGRRSDGKLFLAEDNRGLYFEYELPDTGLGLSLANLLRKRGRLGVSIHSRAREETYDGHNTAYVDSDLREFSILNRAAGANPGAWCDIERGSR